MTRNPSTTSPDNSPEGEPAAGRRPRDLALLLLAAGGEPPRERARDQKADLAGIELRRQVLDRVAALDPDPERFEDCLAAIVLEIGEPSGPTRAVARTVWDDWQSAEVAPEFWPWLMAEAIHATERPRRKRRGGDDVA